MKSEDKTFTITCTMKERWIPHFLGTPKQQQYLGSLGFSRKVTLYADGDGDYRPKFRWDEQNLPSPASPIENRGGDTVYDAG